MPILFVPSSSTVSRLPRETQERKISESSRSTEFNEHVAQPLRELELILLKLKTQLKFCFIGILLTILGFLFIRSRSRCCAFPFQESSCAIKSILPPMTTNHSTLADDVEGFLAGLQTKVSNLENAIQMHLITDRKKVFDVTIIEIRELIKDHSANLAAFGAIKREHERMEELEVAVSDGYSVLDPFVFFGIIYLWILCGAVLGTKISKRSYLTKLKEIPEEDSENLQNARLKKLKRRIPIFYLATLLCVMVQLGLYVTFIAGQYYAGSCPVYYRIERLQQNYRAKGKPYLTKSFSHYSNFAYELQTALDERFRKLNKSMQSPILEVRQLGWDYEQDAIDRAFIHHMSLKQYHVDRDEMPRQLAIYVISLFLQSIYVHACLPLSITNKRQILVECIYILSNKYLSRIDCLSKTKRPLGSFLLDFCSTWLSSILTSSDMGYNSLPSGTKPEGVPRLRLARVNQERQTLNPANSNPSVSTIPASKELEILLQKLKIQFYFCFGGILLTILGFLLIRSLSDCCEFPFQESRCGIKSSPPLMTSNYSTLAEEVDGLLAALQAKVSILENAVEIPSPTDMQKTFDGTNDEIRKLIQDHSANLAAFGDIKREDERMEEFEAAVSHGYVIFALLAFLCTFYLLLIYGSIKDETPIPKSCLPRLQGLSAEERENLQINTWQNAHLKKVKRHIPVFYLACLLCVLVELGFYVTFISGQYYAGSCPVYIFLPRGIEMEKGKKYLEKSFTDYPAFADELKSSLDAHLATLNKSMKFSTLEMRQLGWIYDKHAIDTALKHHLELKQYHVDRTTMPRQISHAPASLLYVFLPASLFVNIVVFHIWTTLEGSVWQPSQFIKYYRS